MVRLALGMMGLAGVLFFGGCGIGSDFSESNVTVSLRVSALTYIRDNNETNETNLTIGALGRGYYISGGRFDFYDENLSGVRVIERGIYLTADQNCSDYGVVIDENGTAPTLKAPAQSVKLPNFGYININPFTTLLIDTNQTLQELHLRFPTAASIDSDFNFDTVSTRYHSHYKDSNLTRELCEALSEVLSLQGDTL